MLSIEPALLQNIKLINCKTFLKSFFFKKKHENKKKIH